MTGPWVLVAWAVTFRRELDALAPKRDKESDGSVGNLAHQGSPSGHNPDETGNAERRDADDINEVRAIDVDVDFNVPGLTAAMLVAWLVGRCRAGLERRLIYIIHNGVIWSASSGWAARTYTGSNPHDKHIHLSGHPDGDADGRPFGLAALVTKEAPDMDAKQNALLFNASSITASIGRMSTTAPILNFDGKPGTPVRLEIVEAVQGLQVAVAALAERPAAVIDYDQLADALLRRTLTGQPATPPGS